MNVLVTGGLGLIGSHIARWYVDHGQEVTVVDNYAANVTEWLDGAAIVGMDVKDVGVLGLSNHYDLVVHCASPVGPVGILPKQGRIVREIVAGTHAAAELASRCGARLVNFSSSEVYGFTGTYHELDACEVHAGYNARREYAVGKLAAEYMLAGLAAAGDLKAVNIRPFNVTGPGQSAYKGFVFPRFAGQLANGEPLTVYGDGRLRRTFLGADDMARFVGEHLLSEPDWSGTVINVGNPDNVTTIAHLASLFVQVNGGGEIKTVKPESIHGSGFAEADGAAKLPNIDHAAGLGWWPSRNLRSLVEWVMDANKEARSSGRLRTKAEAEAEA